MNTSHDFWKGYAPSVVVGPPARPPEQVLYEKMWRKPEYRAVAPGESASQIFLAQARPRRGAKVIDFGCGTGRGGLLLHVLGGMDVTMIDFAANCLDEEVRDFIKAYDVAGDSSPTAKILFKQADLTKPFDMHSQYGFCTDVMEHIPPEHVDTVLNNILDASQHVFFQIATEDDVMGKIVGFPLHLSVHPYEWWLDKFKERNCVVHWSQNGDGGCMFYVTGWKDAQIVVDSGEINTTIEAVKENVRANIKGPWNQVIPHPTNDFEAMILGGAPSLNKHEEQIRQLRADGVKLITLNGAYNWCVDRGITPSAQIMVDAREFNSRFVQPVLPECKYLLASQCHPTAFASLPPERTYIWHTTTELIKDILDEHYGQTWFSIPGGSTVLLRAIPLMRMLGYKKFHLFGCDSCLDESQAHHAYSQPENDEERVFPVTCGNKVFYCHPWMASQGQEFISLIRYLGDEIELAVYGDGLLNHILLTGAELSQED